MSIDDKNNINDNINKKDIIEDFKIEDISTQNNIINVEGIENNLNEDKNNNLEDMERKKAEIKALIAKEKQEK